MTNWMAKYKDRYGVHTINIADSGKKISATFKGKRRIDDVENFVKQLKSVLKTAKKGRRRK